MSGSTCRSCEARMTWALDLRKGKRIPYDIDPVPAGTTGARVLAIADDGKGAPNKLAYPPQYLAAALRDHNPRLSHEQAMRKVYDDYPWHLPHWRTCTEPPAPKPPKQRKADDART